MTTETLEMPVMTGTVTFNSRAMARAMKSLVRIIQAQPILPILEYVHIKVETGQLWLTCGDLQNFITTAIPCESFSARKFSIDAPDVFTVNVPAKPLYALLSRLEEMPLILSYYEADKKLTLEALDCCYEFATEFGPDYPKTPEVKGDVIDIPGNYLEHGLSRNVYAVSNDDLRPAMTGVYLKKEGHTLTIVATDGHRLTEAKYPLENGSTTIAPCIVPGRAAQLIRFLLKKKGVKVGVVYGNNGSLPLMKFLIGSFTLTVRLVDERFPDYVNAIPTTHTTSLKAGRQKLIGVLQRQELFASRVTHQMRLEISDRLKITAEDNDYKSRSTETVREVTVDGPALTIGINGRLATQAFQNIDAGMVELRMTKPNKAIIIRPVDYHMKGVELTVLIMPVMLNEY